MGFLERLQASQDARVGNWIMLAEMDQLDEIDNISMSRPVVLFKHSTSCGISAGAKYRLESDWDQIPEDVSFYFLDLLRYRPISNAIAERYLVRHESPQILVIREGKAIYSASHHRVNISSLIGAIS